MRRVPVLKRLRYYLGQMPPENPAPNKKLNAVSKAAMEGVTKELGEAGLEGAIEAAQESILVNHLQALRRRVLLRS